MNRIRLNHTKSRHGTAKFATAALLLGGLISIAVFTYYQQLTTETDRLQTDMQQSTQQTKHAQGYARTSRVSQQATAREAAKTSEINAAISAILFPWPALFKALEVATPDNITLLVLEPSSKVSNAKQRAFRITAVALNTDSMLAYIDALALQKQLRNVALLSQESTQLNGQAAIQFVIETVWNI